MGEQRGQEYRILSIQNPFCSRGKERVGEQKMFVRVMQEDHQGTPFLEFGPIIRIAQTQSSVAKRHAIELSANGSPWTTQ
jgi:hypothetical protein